MEKRNQVYFEKIFKAIKQDQREAFRDLFLKLHEYDQVQVLDLLYDEKKYKIHQFLTAEEFAEIFDLMEFDQQLSFFEKLPDSFLKEVFSYVSDDNLTHFVQDLADDSAKALHIMKAEDREVIERMLRHKPDTAASLMTTEILTTQPDCSVQEVINHIREVGQQAELIYYIYVVNEERQLLGVLSLKEVLLEAVDTQVRDIMNTQFVSVSLATDQEETARLMQDYDLLAIPVVSANMTLQGIITIDDVMDILDEEMTEDFHRFSGINTGDETEEEESVLDMTKSRLPWIIILIFMGLISANLIKHFEETIAHVVALAAFMPIIMDSAGNVGTQSLAVSVRRITMDQNDDEFFWKNLFKELFSGCIIGFFASIVLGILSFVLHRNLILSGIIAISLWLTLTISTVIGYVVPWFFDKLHIDPAVASGPFITTINDAFGLIIYFSLATYLLHVL